MAAIFSSKRLPQPGSGHRLGFVGEQPVLWAARPGRRRSVRRSSGRRPRRPGPRASSASSRRTGRWPRPGFGRMPGAPGPAASGCRCRRCPDRSTRSTAGGSARTGAASGRSWSRCRSTGPSRSSALDGTSGRRFRVGGPGRTRCGRSSSPPGTGPSTCRRSIRRASSRNGPPPTMSVSGSNSPGRVNSTVVPRASPAARPSSAPRYRDRRSINDPSVEAAAAWMVPARGSARPGQAAAWAGPAASELAATRRAPGPLVPVAARVLPRRRGRGPSE